MISSDYWIYPVRNSKRLIFTSISFKFHLNARFIVSLLLPIRPRLCERNLTFFFSTNLNLLLHFHLPPILHQCQITRITPNYFLTIRLEFSFNSFIFYLQSQTFSPFNSSIGLNNKKFFNKWFTASFSIAMPSLIIMSSMSSLLFSYLAAIPLLKP